MTPLNKNLLVLDTATEGGYQAATFEGNLEADRGAVANRVKKGAALTSPKLTRGYLMTRLSARDHEVFTVIFMDNRHRLLKCLEMLRGTIAGANVHPREVV